MFNKIMNKLNYIMPNIVLFASLFFFFVSTIQYSNHIVSSFYNLFVSILFLILYIGIKPNNTNINVDTVILNKGENNDI